MSKKLLRSGDIIEFTSPLGDKRVRGFVCGFEIMKVNGQEETGIWVLEESNRDENFACWTWNELKEFDFEVIEKGNAPTESSAFVTSDV